MASQVFFVDNLTLPVWAFWVLPRLVQRRLSGSAKITRCHVIDGSRSAMMVARMSAWLAGVSVQKLVFQLVDVRDEAGLLIRLRITFKDLGEVQQIAMADTNLPKSFQNESQPDRLPMFLAKRIVAYSQADRRSVWRALFMVQLCVWQTKREKETGGVPFLFLGHRPWLAAIVKYASSNDVTIVPVPQDLNIRAFLRGRLPPWLIQCLRSLRFSRSRRERVSRNRLAESGQGPVTPQNESGRAERYSGPRIAAPYVTQLNLDQPELNSDFFYWQRSSLPGRAMLVTFENAYDPLDSLKLAELKRHGMEGVPLDQNATTVRSPDVFKHRPFRNQRGAGRHATLSKGPEAAWLNAQITDYQKLRSYWSDFFEKYRVKVYVTWQKHNASHCAIADALQALGGVTAVYQRSYEPLPSAETTVGADVVFGFSTAVADVERSSNSSVRYHVTTGYLGDHRGPLVRDSSQALRDRLRGQGARRILAFTDENSAGDPRWHTGHPFMRQNYAFLLEKLLTEPWLGLIFKPKTPWSLRRRLGPVAELLQRAEATGRCYVFEEGSTTGARAPVEAALASDIAIHGHLCSGTAGMEAALAGVPTLLLDREGWTASPLYRLGLGRVVFTRWEELWEACLQHWEGPERTSGFGDWSPILDELDPFRDGRAAERMGEYVKWLIEGFQAGQDREAVMADAAERYCALWGSDKITTAPGNGAILAPSSDSI